MATATKTRNSRWDNKPRLKDGKPAGFRFEDTDADILSLFSAARLPWPYKTLSTKYFKAILERDSVDDRLRDLVEPPHDYLLKPPQPKTNWRDLIYTISAHGVDKLKELHITPPDARASEVRAHQFLSDITAASFELASRKHPITLGRAHVDLGAVRPDLTFKVNGIGVLMEIDLSTESYIGTGNTIHKKFEHYIELIRDGKLRNTMVLFIGISPSRIEGMIQRLIHTVDGAIEKNEDPYKYAQFFGFRWIGFDKFLTSVLAPSDWAATGDYQRAGRLPPFNFLPKED